MMYYVYNVMTNLSVLKTATFEIYPTNLVIFVYGFYNLCLLHFCVGPGRTSPQVFKKFDMSFSKIRIIRVNL